MCWIYLALAGLFEVGFAVSLKLMEGHKNIFWSAIFYISMVASLGFLSLSLKHIPMSTAYAIWTGIGVLGVVLVGMFYFSEPTTALRILFLVLLLVSIVGLKLTTQPG